MSVRALSRSGFLMRVAIIVALLLGILAPAPANAATGVLYYKE